MKKKSIIVKRKKSLKSSVKTSKVPKKVTKILNIVKNNPVKTVLGTLGVLTAWYAVNKIKNYYTKTVSLSAKITTEEDAIKVIFNPNEVGLWRGDTLIASVFLNEYLYTLPNVCDNKKYNTHILMFGYDGSMAIRSRNSQTPRIVVIDHMIHHFKEVINYSECSSKRFFIIPIVALLAKFGGHSNTLIYDSKNKTMDHFEPYGSHEVVSEVLSNRIIVNNIARICVSIGIKYNNPGQTCPRVGPQFIESFKCPILRIIRNNFKTDIGFCLAWSLLYVELRIKNPDISSKELIKKATDNLGWNLCNFITAYASNILKFSKKFDLITNEQGIAIDYKEKSL